MKKQHIAYGFVGMVGGAVAWKLLTRPGSVSFDGFEEIVHHADSSKFLEVDGITVHLQEFGDPSDPTLLLIHGFSSSTHVWKTVAPMFADRKFHVVAVDLVGFGYSDKPAWFDYRIQSQARMIVRLMNLLGIGRATLVGSSYGGAVAAMAALDYPERIEKLVLVSAVCNDEPKNHPLLRLAEIKGVGEVMTPFLVDSRAFLKHRMRNSFSSTNFDLITEDRVDAVRRPLSNKDGHNAVLQSARNWEAGQVEQDANLIEQPTLILWGEEDRVIPIRNGYTLHREILNSRFVVLRNCGHLPPEEAPGDFVQLITEFCADSKGQFEIDEDSVDALLAGLEDPAQ